VTVTAAWAGTPESFCLVAGYGPRFCPELHEIGMHGMNRTGTVPAMARAHPIVLEGRRKSGRTLCAIAHTAFEPENPIRMAFGASAAPPSRCRNTSHLCPCRGKVLALREQVQHRPRERREDGGLFHHRLAERAADPLAQLGAAVRVDQRNEHLVELVVHEIEPALERDAVVARREGHVPGMRHALFHLPPGDHGANLRASAGRLGEAGEFVAFGDHRADGAREEQGGDVEQLKVWLASNLELLPVEIHAIKLEVDPENVISPSALLRSSARLRPRIATGSKNPSARDRLARRQVPEDLLDADLRQRVVEAKAPARRPSGPCAGLPTPARRTRAIVTGLKSKTPSTASIGSSRPVAVVSGPRTSPQGEMPETERRIRKGAPPGCRMSVNSPLQPLVSKPSPEILSANTTTSSGKDNLGSSSARNAAACPGGFWKLYRPSRPRSIETRARFRVMPSYRSSFRRSGRSLIARSASSANRISEPWLRMRTFPILSRGPGRKRCASPPRRSTSMPTAGCRRFHARLVRIDVHEKQRGQRREHQDSPRPPAATRARFPACGMRSIAPQLEHESGPRSVRWRALGRENRAFQDLPR